MFRVELNKQFKEEGFDADAYAQSYTESDYADRLSKFQAKIKKWTIIDLPYVSGFQRHLFTSGNVVDDLFSLAKCRGRLSQSELVWQ